MQDRNELFDGWINGSVSDLHMLLVNTGHGVHPHAETTWSTRSSVATD
jgi:hypothetical protein